MTDKDKLPGSSKLVSSFQEGTLDSGFGEHTIPGHSPDFQAGQFSGQYGGLSDMIDPALDGEFAERTQTDLTMVPGPMHDDDVHERLTTLLLDCLSAVDDLDKLLVSARKLEVDAKLIVEMEMARKRFLDKLNAHDVTVMPAVGRVVDPAFHEVVREVDAGNPEEHDTIVSVERAGYIQHGHPLRRARVVVGKQS